MNKQVSAEEIATKNPKFVPWLHSLTQVGYEKSVMIESDHIECVALLFIEGKSPEQALPEYVQFKRRWNALTAASQSITDNTPMPFGKYVGKPMVDVPAKYLLWLYNEGCNHDEVRKYLIDNLEALKKEAGESR